MEAKKKLFGGQSPHMITQEQMDANMKRAFSQGQQQQKPISFAPKGQQHGSWKPPKNQFSWTPPTRQEQQLQQPIQQPQARPLIKQQNLCQRNQYSKKKHHTGHLKNGKIGALSYIKTTQKCESICLLGLLKHSNQNEYFRLCR